MLKNHWHCIKRNVVTVSSTVVLWIYNNRAEQYCSHEITSVVSLSRTYNIWTMKCGTQNKRNILKCIVSFIVELETKTIPFFHIWQTDAARKTDVFCIHVIIILKTKQNLTKKIDRTLSNTPKQTSMWNLELFWQCSILANNLQCPFSTKPFNYLPFYNHLSSYTNYYYYI